MAHGRFLSFASAKVQQKTKIGKQKVKNFSHSPLFYCLYLYYIYIMCIFAG